MPHSFGIGAHPDQQCAAHGLDARRQDWEAVLRLEKMVKTCPSAQQVLSDLHFARHQLVRELAKTMTDAKWDPSHGHAHEALWLCFAGPMNTKTFLEEGKGGLALTLFLQACLPACPNVIMFQAQEQEHAPGLWPERTLGEDTFRDVRALQRRCYERSTRWTRMSNIITSGASRANAHNIPTVALTNEDWVKPLALPMSHITTGLFTPPSLPAKAALSKEHGVPWDVGMCTAEDLGEDQPKPMINVGPMLKGHGGPSWQLAGPESNFRAPTAMIMCRKLLPMASNEEVERAIDQKWWVSLLGKGYLFKMGGDILMSMGAHGWAALCWVMAPTGSEGLYSSLPLQAHTHEDADAEAKPRFVWLTGHQVAGGACEMVALKVELHTPLPRPL